MSDKSCDVCGNGLGDGESVMAIIQSKYRDIPSLRSFAMDKPTDCVKIAHSECYWMNDDFNDDISDEYYGGIDD